MLYKKIFSSIKKIIPRISETELIALRSGTTSIDQEIFKGKVNYPPIIKKEDKFDHDKIDELLKNYGGNQHIYPNGPYKDLFKKIGKEKFLSFIIDEKYGGTHLSVNELSNILTKISSVNPALGVSIMVPNSLGPGELLQNYGTTEQKNMYLPGLADGTYIPCFGLTGPNNGSDATGEIDNGEVVINEHGEKCINIVLNKRYITLGPIANLIGIAFNLHDPFELLEKGKQGITVALIENTQTGLKQFTHHNPLNAGFPNGTLKGSIQIPINKIIGGEKNAGNGWKMLMECLAAGRGICLPATAKASSNTSLLGVLEYAKHRKQFKIPLIKMEGVQEKLASMIYNTWLINCSIALTNNLLDSGEKPAVISAIMKQQTTDRARDILNHAMDIHAGGAICIGKNNFLEKFYRAAPIGITVEGSNTLTRNLIIFGQGLNKSHPYIFPILDNILNDDSIRFKDNFNKIVYHSLTAYKESFFSRASFNTLEKQTKHFANLANFIALKGGSLKGEQMLSSDMADLLSNLYLAHSVEWYHKQHKISKILTNYCVEKLCIENQIIFNRVIDNNSYLKLPLFFIKEKIKSEQYIAGKNLVKEMEDNPFLIKDLQKDIITKGTALEDLYKLSETKHEDEYKKLYNEVIQVDEFPNP
jgi:acyl-CoA dehydrogenase